jgi:ankyrin repeat protein
MKNFYENLSTDELLKKRALGTESLTTEAHEIIANILKGRGVTVPPLYEKAINIDEIKAKGKINVSSIDYAYATVTVIAALLISEILKALLKSSGILINLVFGATAILVWLVFYIQKQNKSEAAELEDRLGKEGFNELMACAVDGNLERLLELLNYKADVDKKDNNGYTALMYAASNGRNEVVETLLAAGADKSIKTKKGNTALDFAKKYAHSQICEMLS